MGKAEAEARQIAQQVVLQWARRGMAQEQTSAGEFPGGTWDGGAKKEDHTGGEAEAEDDTDGGVKEGDDADTKVKRDGE